MIHLAVIKLKSHNPAPKLMDITKKVARVVERSAIKTGQVLVFARHTTCGIILQEDEAGLKDDLCRRLQSLAHPKENYAHNQSPDHRIDGLGNGHSHLQQVTIGPSEIIPLHQGKMMLGTFQKIFLVELDRTRLREIVVQVTGE